MHGSPGFLPLHTIGNESDNVCSTCSSPPRTWAPAAEITCQEWRAYYGTLSQCKKNAASGLICVV